MTQPKQIPLFLSDNDQGEAQHDNGYYSGREIGTFKDSLRTPIHRWFRYPAGYSYKFVLESFGIFGLQPGQWVYDPFSGTGTTLICAKQQGINAYGVEAHSFVHWVAEVKLYWDFDYKLLGKELDKILKLARRTINNHASTKDGDIDGVFPELVCKCYHPQDLRVLYTLREFILNEIEDWHIQNLLELALTATLRTAALAGTGWPYISPRKNSGERPPKDALSVFLQTVTMMYRDLEAVAQKYPPCDVRNILGDSRKTQDMLEDGQFRLALTSPPYLNNYDYADRTRLEVYFWGNAKTWGDITRLYRDKLMVAATTQVNRSEINLDSALSDEIRDIAPDIYTMLRDAVYRLADLRLKKGGKKDYDLMTALYFSQMLQVIKEVFRVLEPKGHFCLVLGDSAPYGVHIPTDDIVGRLGVALGFRKYSYYPLRSRGGKWKANPQRHNVPLREGIIVLTK